MLFLLKLQRRYGLVYYETSALTPTGGIADCVDRLVKKVMERVDRSVEKDYMPMKR